jgi:predicted DNA-binding transcriptional regulator AlpA
MQDPGSNINYWLESEIDQVIQRQAERRDEPQQAAA